jgi:hypothetical protein
MGRVLIDLPKLANANSCLSRFSPWYFRILIRMPRPIGGHLGSTGGASGCFHRLGTRRIAAVKQPWSRSPMAAEVFLVGGQRDVRLGVQFRQQERSVNPRLIQSACRVSGRRERSHQRKGRGGVEPVQIHLSAPPRDGGTPSIARLRSKRQAVERRDRACFEPGSPERHPLLELSRIREEKALEEGASVNGNRIRVGPPLQR